MACNEVCYYLNQIDQSYGYTANCKVNCNLSLLTSLERPLSPCNKSSVRNMFEGSIYPYGRNSEKNSGEKITSFVVKRRAIQQKCSLSSTPLHWINCIPKIVLEFVKVQCAKTNP